MSLILCYCEKCGQHYDESDEELNNLKNIICIGCGKAGYFKPVPKEYLYSMIFKTFQSDLDDLVLNSRNICSP